MRSLAPCFAALAVASCGAWLGLDEDDESERSPSADAGAGDAAGSDGETTGDGGSSDAPSPSSPTCDAQLCERFDPGVDPPYQQRWSAQSKGTPGSDFDTNVDVTRSTSAPASLHVRWNAQQGSGVFWTTNATYSPLPGKTSLVVRFSLWIDSYPTKSFAVLAIGGWQMVYDATTGMFQSVTSSTTGTAFAPPSAGAFHAWRVTFGRTLMNVARTVTVDGAIKSYEQVSPVTDLDNVAISIGASRDGTTSQEPVDVWFDDVFVE